MRHIPGHLSPRRRGARLGGGQGTACCTPWSGLNFNPGEGGNDAFGRGGLQHGRAVRRHGPGRRAAGPGRTIGPGSLAGAPGNGACSLPASSSLAFVLVKVNRARLRAERAWLRTGVLPDWRTSVLVTAARASLVGPRIALDYRYEAELGATAAIGAGAPRDPAPSGRGGVVRAAAGRANWSTIPSGSPRMTALVAVLGTVSTVQYVTRMAGTTSRPSRWFGQHCPRSRGRSSRSPHGRPAGPGATSWSPLEYPDNQLSHLPGVVRRPGRLRRPLDGRADRGRRRRPAPRRPGIPPTRFRTCRSLRPGCGWAVSDEPVSVSPWTARSRSAGCGCGSATWRPGQPGAWSPAGRRTATVVRAGGPCGVHGRRRLR